VPVDFREGKFTFERTVHWLRSLLTPRNAPSKSRLRLKNAGLRMRAASG